MSRSLLIGSATVAAVLVCALLAEPVAAQDMAVSRRDSPSVELTPFIGYQFGGSFVRFFDDGFLSDVDLESSESYGLMVDFYLTRRLVLELLWSRQDTALEADRSIFQPRDSLGLDLDYYHLGLLYQFQTGGQWHPYFGGSLGATELSPERGSSETKFSFSLGGGVKLMVAEHLGFRFDGRLYSTVIDSDDYVVCDYYCYRYDDSTYLNQWDIKAGLIVAF